MRECLGWLTNCPDERRCPQNWLELAVSELPTAINCHVCEQGVQLVLGHDELEDAAASNGLAAFPIVPCAGAPAWYGDAGGDGGHIVHERANGASHGAVARPSAHAPVQAQVFFCVLGNGEQIKVDKDTMIIGRSRTCDIVIQSAKVSRQHASLTKQDGDYYLEDLGSANGVWKGGEKISRVKVEDGDVFTISEETLTFELR